MKRLLVLLMIVWSCDQFEGPVGPAGPPGEQGATGEQGDSGPAYPDHGLTNISGLVITTDQYPYYVGLNFDTKGLWTGIDLNDTGLYDIIFTIDYNYSRRISISGGNNPFTELYVVDNVSSLQGISEIPAQDSKRNVLVYSESGGDIYFMVKNKYNRWAKVKYSGQRWDYNVYSLLTENHYFFWSLIEWYFYKDLEPDLTLHKVQ